jgi:hypothetical protein
MDLFYIASQFAPPLGFDPLLVDMPTVSIEAEMRLNPTRREFSSRRRWLL